MTEDPTNGGRRFADMSYSYFKEPVGWRTPMEEETETPAQRYLRARDEKNRED